MTLKNLFKTDLSVVIFLLLTAAIAAHKMLINVYVHHADWLIIFKVIDYGRQWFQQTGSFTLWTPFLTGGLTYISNVPFVLSANQILSFAGFSATFSTFLLEWISISLAAISIYFLGRMYGLSRGAALTTAILHQYFTATWLSLEELPAAVIATSFLLCELYEERRRFAYIYINSLLVGLYALTAIPHGLFIALAFQWLVAFARASNGTGRRFALATCSSTIIGLVLALPTLLPTARDAAVSYRIYFVRPQLDYTGMTIVEAFRNFFVTGFQIENLGPVLFITAVLTAVAALFLQDRKMRTIYWLGVLFILFLCLATNTQGFIADAPVIGKLLNAFDMQRNFVTPFCTALFSGFCVQGLMTRREALTHKQIGAIVVILFFAFVLWLTAGTRFREYTLLAFIGLAIYFWMQSFCSAEMRDRYAPRFLAALAVFCVFVLAQSHVKDMLQLSLKIGISPIKAVYDDAQLKPRTEYNLRETPENARQLTEILTAATASDYSRVIDRDVFSWPQRSYFPIHDVPTLQYFDNTSTARFREFFMCLVDDLRLSRPIVYRNLLHTALFYAKDGSSFNENLLSLGGVRWILEPKAYDEHRFEQVWTGTSLSLYRNDKAFPKALAVFDVKIVADKEAMSQHLLNASLEDLRSTVPLRAEDASGFPQDFLSGTGQAAVNLVRYTPNEVVVDVEATENCVLVLGDTYHSIWKATLDGAPEKIFHAYNTFRMVPVPKGAHQIRFFVHDELFSLAIRISLATLLALTLGFGASLLAARRKRG